MSTTTTFAELQAASDSQSLIRKVLRAVAFIGPMTAALPDALTDTTGKLLELPETFLPVGIVTPDGYTFGKDIDKDDIDALGYSAPVRSDIVAVARTISFTVLEYGKKNLNEVAAGMVIAATQDSGSGEIVYDEPSLPIGAEYRLLVLGDDGAPDANWILGKGYPRVKLSDLGEEAWAKEGAVEQEFTFDVFTDDALGTPVRNYLAGTGAKAAADALGYSQST